MVAAQHEAADAPLRRDVRLLGDLLGRVLVEQEDESLLADVERVRGLARAAREGGPADDLAAAVAPLPLERQASVLRAFATYFQLAQLYRSMGLNHEAEKTLRSGIKVAAKAALIDRRHDRIADFDPCLTGPNFEHPAGKLTDQ